MGHQKKKLNDIVFLYLLRLNSVMANKAKTHKGAAKRFKVTKTGKVRYKKPCNNHLLTNKGKNNKSDAYGENLKKADVKNIKNLLS